MHYDKIQDANLTQHGGKSYADGIEIVNRDYNKESRLMTLTLKNCKTITYYFPSKQNLL